MFAIPDLRNSATRRCKTSRSDSLSGSSFFHFYSDWAFLFSAERSRIAKHSAAFRTPRYAIRHCSIPNSAQLADYFPHGATWVFSEPMGVPQQRRIFFVENGGHGVSGIANHPLSK